jgi:hypothetical protein
MMQRTADGLVINFRSLRFVALIGSLAVVAITGMAGAVRFVDQSRDAPTRTEFDAHVRADSEIHAKQSVHDAFQDSLISQQSRDNHGVVCFVYHNPLPFCADQASQMQQPTVRRIP